MGKKFLQKLVVTPPYGRMSTEWRVCSVRPQWWRTLFWGEGACLVTCRNLVPEPGIKPMPPALGAQSLNHIDHLGSPPTCNFKGTPSILLNDEMQDSLSKLLALC